MIIDVFNTKKGEDLNYILLLVLVYGIVYLLQTVSQNLSQLATEAQQQKVADFMSRLIQKKSIKIDLAFYEDPTYLNIFDRVQRQGLFVPTQILNNLSSFIQNTFSLLAISGLLIYLQWYVLLIIILATLPKIFVRLLFSKKLYNWEKDTTQTQRESNYLNKIITDPANAKELKVFNYGNYFSDKFSNLRRALFSGLLKINKLKFWMTLIATSAEVGAATFAYGIIAWNTYKGIFTVGELVLYIQAYQKAQGLFQKQLIDLVKLREKHFFLKDLFQFLNMKSSIETVTNSVPLLSLIKDEIIIKNISFSYPQQNHNALKNATLNLKKGEVTAIVGSNGSGKTTLVKLLSRLYDPNTGEICVDGINIKKLNVHEWRKKISIIFQDFSRYDLPVTENISISNLNEKINIEKVKNSASSSGANKFVEKLNKGYHNILGKKFDGGVELSGGQWQKIALSRVFYKDSEIIVLDEPTSAIDPLAEYEIFKKLKSLARNKIVILITHRLYNLKLADKIYLLENGIVAEEGNHNQLMKLNGKYNEMFEKQS